MHLGDVTWESNNALVGVQGIGAHMLPTGREELFSPKSLLSCQPVASELPVFQ